MFGIPKTFVKLQMLYYNRRKLVKQDLATLNETTAIASVLYSLIYRYLIKMVLIMLYLTICHV
jgi:hypothetical protein